VVVNGDPSPEVLSLILETQRMVAAVNNRIDRLTVKVNAEDVYDAALEQKELKSTQTL
jgi:hypothetical protein